MWNSKAIIIIVQILKMKIKMNKNYFYYIRTFLPYNVLINLKPKNKRNFYTIWNKKKKTKKNF